MPTAAYALQSMRDLEFVDPNSFARYSQWGVPGDGCGGWSVKGATHITNENGRPEPNMLQKAKVRLDRAPGMQKLKAT